jgi:hypothetical protein
VFGNDGFASSDSGVEYDVQSSFTEARNISVISRRLRAMNRCEMLVWNAMQKMTMNESNPETSIKGRQRECVVNSSANEERI